VIIIYACLAVFVAEALVLRRRLARLMTLRIRRIYLVWLALANEVVVISILPGHQTAAFAAANFVSYLVAGVFVWSNRHIPGLLLLAGGGGLNAAAIVANAGVMPASAQALAASGWRPLPGHFANSAVLAHPRVAFLGDIFATPRWMPGHDVFSIGDVVIVVAFAILIYRTCAVSRAPSLETDTALPSEVIATQAPPLG
jgi:hypothetical protein